MIELTLLEVLATAAFVTSVTGKVALWFKKAWGWLIGVLGAYFWILYSITLWRQVANVGAPMLLASEAFFLAIYLIGYLIWKRHETEFKESERQEATTAHSSENN